jgi:hypothetical protein
VSSRRDLFADFERMRRVIDQLLAAQRAGINRLIIPRRNRADSRAAEGGATKLPLNPG